MRSTRLAVLPLVHVGVPLLLLTSAEVTPDASAPQVLVALAYNKLLDANVLKPVPPEPDVSVPLTALALLRFTVPHDGAPPLTVSTLYVEPTASLVNELGFSDALYSISPAAYVL